MIQSEPIYSLKGKRVWVAGHNGMVGSALVRRLAQIDCTLLTTARNDLDLTRQAEVEAWMKDTKPQAVFMAAAKVGGIAANDRWPAQFLYDNLAIAANVINAAEVTDVEKLLFLGSSRIYHSVREFIELAFAQVGRKITWQGTGQDEVGIDEITGLDLVKVDRRYFRPTEVDALLGDATKARQALGWRPEVSLTDLVAEMVKSDLKVVAVESERKDRGAY